MSSVLWVPVTSLVAQICTRCGQFIRDGDIEITKARVFDNKKCNLLVSPVQVTYLADKEPLI